MHRFTLARWLAAVFTLAAATAAQADQVNPTYPESVLSAVKARGWSAKLVIRTDENPVIEVNRDGVKTMIFFMNCNDSHHDCLSVQFYLGYNDAKSTTLERLNEWNRKKRFGRAYRDNDGDPVMEMDVDLDKGGIPRELFNEYMVTWESLTSAFAEHIFPK